LNREIQTGADPDLNWGKKRKSFAHAWFTYSTDPQTKYHTSFSPNYL